MENKPKIWKMLLISWLFVYPVINLMFVLIFPLLVDLPQLAKTFCLQLFLFLLWEL